MNRFAKCDSCQQVKDELKATKDSEDKTMFLNFREKHLTQQK